MRHLSTRLAADVADRHGIVTADQLAADGLSEHMVRRLVTAGVLVRCHRGVFRLATAPATFEARCAAACAASPLLVIGAAAAARLWGYRHVDHPAHPVVLARLGTRPLSDVEIRRTSVLEPEDWVARRDGIRVASPPRTWFDCATDLDDDRFEQLTEWVLDHHVRVPALIRVVRRMGDGGRPDRARARRVLGSRPAWQKPAGSGLELRVLRGLERRGVRGLVRQFPIQLADGVVVHPDGAIPEIRWALEVDHVTWHGGRLDAQADKARDRRLRAVGWQVDRVTDADVRDHFQSTIDELVALIDLRRSEFTTRL